jgi:large subunit ribosomal protein L18e
VAARVRIASLAPVKKITQKMATDNENMQMLIQELKKKSIDDSTKIWKRLAVDLERPTRIRRVVNLSRINRFTKENETIIVPGKVLASGEINHKIIVAAFNFSEQAKQKIEEKKGQCITIQEAMDKNPKGMRIIG